MRNSYRARAAQLLRIFLIVISFISRCISSCFIFEAFERSFKGFELSFEGFELSFGAFEYSFHRASGTFICKSCLKEYIDEMSGMLLL